jgi:16S rRNA processing protein RimM
MIDSNENWVWLARVRRPQGRKGEVFAEILTDFPDKFTERRHVWLLKDEGAAPLKPGAPSTRGGALSMAGVSPAMGGKHEPVVREMELVNHWQHKGGIVLHFAGIDSISAAETLTGLVVAIPQSQRAVLAEDEVYIADLIGCSVVDVAGPEPREVGRIRNVDRSAGPVPLLIVDAKGSEILIPFAKSYLRSIDLANQRVEMALPEGLVDLNQ